MSLITEWFRDVNKKYLIGGVLVFLVLVIGLFYVMSGGDAEDGGVSPDGEFPLVSGGGPVDLGLVEESVAATVAALQPTPTPTPPPDIAATLRAEIFSGQMDRLVLSPLDSAGSRTPYLSEAEIDYFDDLGARLWVYTKVWLHVRNVMFVDPSDWSLEDVERDVAQARALLRDVSERRSPPGDVSEIVVTYGRTVEEGMSELGHAVTLLEKVLDILGGDSGEGAAVPGDRQEILRLVRDVEDSLDAFDRAMSAYGCSICGELFRQEGGG